MILFNTFIKNQIHKAFRIKSVNWQRFSLILNILRRLEGSTDGILRLLFPTYTTLEAPKTEKISNSVQYIFKKIRIAKFFVSNMLLGNVSDQLRRILLDLESVLKHLPRFFNYFRPSDRLLDALRPPKVVILFDTSFKSQICMSFPFPKPFSTFFKTNIDSCGGFLDPIWHISNHFVARFASP